jgi:hypothetical protein
MLRASRRSALAHSGGAIAAPLHDAADNDLSGRRTNQLAAATKSEGNLTGDAMTLQEKLCTTLTDLPKLGFADS